MGWFESRVLPGAFVAVTVVALMVLARWLNAFGPMVLSEQHWPGKVLSVTLFVAGILLAVSFGFGALDWRDIQGTTAFAAVAAGLILLFGGFIAVEAAVADYAFAERGRTTSCRVADVEKRVQWMYAAPGAVTSSAYYDHRLNCGAVLGRVMITDRERVGDPGQYLQVQYDPAGRLDPRFAGDGWDPGFLLLIGGAGLVLAVGLWSFAESRAGREVSADTPG